MSETEVRAGPDGFPRVYIDPMDNILVGSVNILRYLGIDSLVTFYTWVELYGLPAIKRPDGMWMSSITSIDQWIFLGAEVDRETRPKSRGSANTHSEAIRLAEKNFGKDSDQADLVRRSHEHFVSKGVNTLKEGRPSRAKAGGSSGLLSEKKGRRS